MKNRTHVSSSVFGTPSNYASYLHSLIFPSSSCESIHACQLEETRGIYVSLQYQVGYISFKLEGLVGKGRRSSLSLRSQNPCWRLNVYGHLLFPATSSSLKLRKRYISQQRVHNGDRLLFKVWTGVDEARVFKALDKFISTLLGDRNYRQEHFSGL